jgi:hypothetical protein
LRCQLRAGLLAIVQVASAVCHGGVCQLSCSGGGVPRPLGKDLRDGSHAFLLGSLIQALQLLHGGCAVWEPQAARRLVEGFA